MPFPFNIIHYCSALVFSTTWKWPIWGYVGDVSMVNRLQSWIVLLLAGIIENTPSRRKNHSLKALINKTRLRILSAGNLSLKETLTTYGSRIPSQLFIAWVVVTARICYFSTETIRPFFDSSTQTPNEDIMKCHPSSTKKTEKGKREKKLKSRDFVTSLVHD